MNLWCSKSLDNLPISTNIPDRMLALNILVMLPQSKPCQCNKKARIDQKAKQYAHRSIDK
jgi:hypothetical protein